MFLWSIYSKDLPVAIFHLTVWGVCVSTTTREGLSQESESHPFKCNHQEGHSLCLTGPLWEDRILTLITTGERTQLAESHLHWPTLGDFFTSRSLLSPHLPASLSTPSFLLQPVQSSANRGGVLCKVHSFPRCNSYCWLKSVLITLTCVGLCSLLMVV